MMQRVIKDSAGNVINIGPWEFIKDDNGVIVNPLPPGCYEDMAEIVTDDDGGKHHRVAWLPKEATRLLKAHGLCYSRRPMRQTVSSTPNGKRGVNRCARLLAV